MKLTLIKGSTSDRFDGCPCPRAHHVLSVSSIFNTSIVAPICGQDLKGKAMRRHSRLIIVRIRVQNVNFFKTSDVESGTNNQRCPLVSILAHEFVLLSLSLSLYIYNLLGPMGNDIWTPSNLCMAEDPWRLVLAQGTSVQGSSRL